MSVPEYEQGEPILGGLSKVKIVRNTRGVNFEISVVQGTTETEMDEIRRIAIRQQEELSKLYPDAS